MNIEVDRLNERISRRFENMVTNGALEEVKDNRLNWSATLPGFQAIGAKQLLDYVNNEISLKEAIDTSIIRTRQYAKRQRTWFRSKMKNWTELSN
jgi:tRNA dimethylallyltransferase